MILRSQRHERSADGATKSMRLALLSAGFAALSASGAHATDGYFAHGAGTKAKGAGGAAIASARDSLAIAANPASALDLGDRLDVGVEVFQPRRSATISGNGFGPDASYGGDETGTFFIPEFGYVRQVNDHLAWGVAVYGNGGMNTSYANNPFQRFSMTPLRSAGVNFEQIFVSPTLAVRLAEGHSIGFSANVVAQAFRAKGLQPFASASSDPANFTNRSTDTAFGLGARIGWLGHLTDKFSAGAFYQTRTYAQPFEKYAGLFAEHGDFDVPSSYGIGVDYKLTDTIDVAFDVRRINLSEIASVGTPISPLTVSGIPFGADDGPGFGWRDVTAYKVGMNWRTSTNWTLRAGYNYVDQPIPEGETFLNILAPGVVTHHYTAGATWALDEHVELSGYALYAPENIVAGGNSIPPGAPPGFGGGEADIGLSQTALGFAVGWRY